MYLWKTFNGICNLLWNASKKQKELIRDKSKYSKMSIVVDAHMNIHCTIPSTFLYVGKHKNVKGNFYAIKDTPPPKKVIP